MPKLEKDAHAPLNVTQKANHRVFAGLGWDPNARFGLLDEARALVGGKKVHHDLDLSCFLYDSTGNFISSVSAHPGQHIDETGQIYHSGDNTEGLGDGDDEQISIELKNLDPTIHHIIFTATIKSGHSFSEVESPEIRIADGYSGHNFFHTPLNHPDGQDTSAFILARIYRSQDSWNIHNIEDYCPPPEDWPEFLQHYLN